MLESDSEVFTESTHSYSELTRSWNGIMIAPSSVRQRLEDTLDYGFLPAPTSNKKLLCAPRGLAEALHTLKLRIRTRERSLKQVYEIKLEK